MRFKINSASATTGVATTGSHYVKFAIHPADPMHMGNTPQWWFLWGGAERVQHVFELIRHDSVPFIDLVKRSIKVEPFQYTKKDGEILPKIYTNYVGWFRSTRSERAEILADYENEDAVIEALRARYDTAMQNSSIVPAEAPETDIPIQTAAEIMSELGSSPSDDLPF